MAIFSKTSTRKDIWMIVVALLVLAAVLAAFHKHETSLQRPDTRSEQRIPPVTALMRDASGNLTGERIESLVYRSLRAPNKCYEVIISSFDYSTGGEIDCKHVPAK